MKILCCVYIETLMGCSYFDTDVNIGRVANGDPILRLLGSFDQPKTGLEPYFRIRFTTGPGLELNLGSD